MILRSPFVPPSRCPMLNSRSRPSAAVGWGPLLALVCIRLQLQAHLEHGTDADSQARRAARLAGRVHRRPAACGRAHPAPAGRADRDLQSVPEPDRARASPAVGRGAAAAGQGAAGLGRDPVRPCRDPRSRRPSDDQRRDGRAGRPRDHRAAEARPDRRLLLLRQGERDIGPGRVGRPSEPAKDPQQPQDLFPKEKGNASQAQFRASQAVGAGVGVHPAVRGRRPDRCPRGRAQGRARRGPGEGHPRESASCPASGRCWRSRPRRAPTSCVPS